MDLVGVGVGYATLEEATPAEVSGGHPDFKVGRWVGGWWRSRSLRQATLEGLPYRYAVYRT